MIQAIKTERKRCKSTKKDGTPCQGLAVNSGDYCFSHEPELLAKRNEARARGGQNSAKIVRLRGLVPPRLLEVYATLEVALAEVHSGSLNPAQAGAMASIARAMVAVLTSGELEERVRELESKTGVIK